MITTNKELAIELCKQLGGTYVMEGRRAVYHAESGKICAVRVTGDANIFVRQGANFAVNGCIFFFYNGNEGYVGYVDITGASECIARSSGIKVSVTNPNLKVLLPLL